MKTLFVTVLILISCSCFTTALTIHAQENKPMDSKENWKKKLTPEQYFVCHDGGTESPFSGKYVNHHEKGTYTCVVCGNQLFSSDTKFDSGSGWPSFYDIANSSAVIKKEDRSHGMVRTEVLCGRCGAHLGHVFPDGPKPTGQRYCINSVALSHEPHKEQK
jgi:peptide-methionine (R)-S-oxide reductase